MTKKPAPPSQEPSPRKIIENYSLRNQAETQLRGQKATTPSVEQGDTQRLLHELQVQQLELEMQNEELVRQRGELEKFLRQYYDLYDFAPVGYFTLDTDSVIRKVNLAGANLLGLDVSKLVKQRFGGFVAPQALPTFNIFWKDLLENQGNKTCELMLQKKGGTPVWVVMDATCFEAGQETRLTLQNITERKQVEEQLRLQSAALDAAANAIIITDRVGAIQWTNLAFETLTGYTPAEALGKNMRSLIKSGKNELFIYKQMWDTILAGKVWSGELINRRKDGSFYHEEQTITPLRDESDAITRFIAVKQDISERKLAEAALRHKSTHDILTDLYNRVFFDEELQRLEGGRKYPVSIVMVDVDHLKQTNDSQGHAAGDALLKQVAIALTTAFRSEDVVARIGGDEFAVLLPSTGVESARISLQRVRQVINEYNSAHPEAPISISLGVSTTRQPGSLLKALKEADADMYLEKREKYDS